MHILSMRCTYPARYPNPLWSESCSLAYHHLLPLSQSLARCCALSLVHTTPSPEVGPCSASAAHSTQPLASAAAHIRGAVRTTPISPHPGGTGAIPPTSREYVERSETRHTLLSTRTPTERSKPKQLGTELPAGHAAGDGLPMTPRTKHHTKHHRRHHQLQSDDRGTPMRQPALAAAANATPVPLSGLSERLRPDDPSPLFVFDIDATPPSPFNAISRKLSFSPKPSLASLLPSDRQQVSDSRLSGLGSRLCAADRATATAQPLPLSLPFGSRHAPSSDLLGEGALP